MAWQELVRTAASFRGVVFNVDTAERSGGRRGVTHEYPFRDKPFREDLGGKVRPFTIDGHVIGVDYLSARDILITALEAFGPGELVHPYYGTRKVAVLDFRVREAAAEGGLARFSIDFEETDAVPLQPTATVDTGIALRGSAATARTAVGDEFTAGYAPGIHMDSLAGAVAAAATAVDAALQASEQEIQDAAASAARTAALVADAAALADSGADVLAALVDLFDSISGLASADLLVVYSSDLGEHPSDATSNRVIEGENFDALQRLVQRLTILRAAELALEETFENHEAAIAARDGIADLLDEQAELVGDDSYPALIDLRSKLVQAVPGTDSQLPHLIMFTPPETVPSLVLAHRLYGSVALEGGVLARNGIANPVFVVGGAALEVLSDG